jgi:hypothetical protein
MPDVSTPLDNLFDWVARNHNAVEAIAAVATAVVAFLAFCRPLIAEWFTKCKYWRELRADTRAVVAGLRKHVQAVADRATAARAKLSAHEHHPPKDDEWTAFDDGASVELPAQLDFLWHHSELASRTQIRPYADLAELVRSYNNSRSLICIRDREAAKSDWARRWREMQDALSAVTHAADALLVHK